MNIKNLKQDLKEESDAFNQVNLEVTNYDDINQNSKTSNGSWSPMEQVDFVSKSKYFGKVFWLLCYFFSPVDFLQPF